MIAKGNKSIRLTVTPETMDQINVIRTVTGETKSAMIKRLVEQDYQLIKAGFDITLTRQGDSSESGK